MRRFLAKLLYPEIFEQNDNQARSLKMHRDCIRSDDPRIAEATGLVTLAEEHLDADMTARFSHDNAMSFYRMLRKFTGHDQATWKVPVDKR